VGKYKYHFDSNIYANRVFDSKGVADPDVEIQLGPNIKDWPAMGELPENLVLRVVSEIHDPVTTTDELIPSGETSSYRSNPLGLAEFALSRKDPMYVGRAKEIRGAQEALMAGKCPGESCPQLELKQVFDTMSEATGVDLSEIMRANTYDAKVNRKIELSGNGVSITPNQKDPAEDEGSTESSESTADDAEDAEA
jgi:aconitase A